MKKTVVLSVMSVMSVMSVLTLMVVTGAVVVVAGAGGEEMVVHVSESNCKTKHADHSKESIECVKSCVDGGATPLLVTEEDVFEVTNPETLEGHLGHEVKVVVSKADDGKLTVESVEHVAP